MEEYACKISAMKKKICSERNEVMNLYKEWIPFLGSRLGELKKKY